MDEDIVAYTFDFSKCKNATQALFYEHRNDLISPVFTKYASHRKVGNKTYYSIRRLFVDTKDPTGMLFVKRYFQGDLAHWNKVKDALDGYILNNSSTDDWLREMELKIKSEALQAVIRDADDKESMSQISSCKWILEEKWKPKAATDARKKGIRAQADEQAKALEQSVQQDIDRVTHLFEVTQ